MSTITGPTPRRRRRSRLAVLAGAALLGGLGAASAATAAPPVPFETVPGSLNFGSVPLGWSSTKPVRMINRTTETMSYGVEGVGNYWPNFANPSSWIDPATGSTWPYGVWNVSGDAEEFPCYEIAPKSSCVLNFRFTPKVLGPWITHFEVHYTGETSGKAYGSTTDMRGTGIPVPPPM